MLDRKQGKDEKKSKYAAQNWLQFIHLQGLIMTNMYMNIQTKTFW